MVEYCTCDDNCDDPCPRHAVENALDERLTVVTDKLNTANCIRAFRACSPPNYCTRHLLDEAIKLLEDTCTCNQAGYTCKYHRNKYFFSETVCPR